MLRKKFGDLGERIAQRYMEEKGYALWRKNFHGRVGEIDLVMLKRRIFLCVEVKLRTSLCAGYPEEAFTYQKMRKVYIVAYKVQQEYFPDHTLRIDGISIRYDTQKRTAFLKHWPNLFI